jgi:hypothetical protein
LQVIDRPPDHPLQARHLGFKGIELRLEACPLPRKREHGATLLQDSVHVPLTRDPPCSLELLLLLLLDREQDGLGLCGGERLGKSLGGPERNMGCAMSIYVCVAATVC